MNAPTPTIREVHPRERAQGIALKLSPFVEFSMRTVDVIEAGIREDRCARTFLESIPADGGTVKALQDRVRSWTLECFGDEIACDLLERMDRFTEEALELVQSLGYTPDRAHALVDYVFGREAGEPSQETGGTMTTLAALCNVAGIDIEAAFRAEVERITTPAMVMKIRAKQAAKPTGSALPVALSTHTAAEAGPVGEAVAWRGIASAPKDGTWFVARQDGETYACQWHTERSEEGVGDEGWWDLFHRSFEEPTEWFPAGPTRPVDEPGEVARLTRERDANARDGYQCGQKLADTEMALEVAEAALAETRERLEKDREVERRHWQAKVDALNAECEATLLRAETAEIALAAREVAR